MQQSPRRIFLDHQAQTTHFPLLLEMERAEGCYIYDTSGKAYLDLISGIGVSNLGHGNSAIKEAIKVQVEKHMHLMVYGEFVMSPQYNLAQKLTSILPDSLNSVYLVNSGTEAVEGALKLAKAYTGRHEIIAMQDSYHGSTHGSLSLNSHEYFKNPFRPLLPGIQFIEAYKEDGLTTITKKTACVIIETIRGESGYPTPDASYLKALRNRCDETGTLLILDEIQCGMGRSGSVFAFEQFGIVPDILLLGKALGGGLPIGAFISSKEIMNRFADKPILGHITTFGGNPVVCAAAYAGILELERLNVINEVKAKSELFMKLLKHPLIKKTEGYGLMISLEFENFELNKRIIDACIEDGLLTDWFLFATNRMRLAPPLIITEKQIKDACKIILTNCEKFKSN